ncbi:DUF4935 domain-containing protein [Corallococcus exiguus]|uniref:PIN domain-containing protein n=1 Tax=Corallococcus exiguus TaxID=83462 RepID=UPI001493F9C1|nr:PIN domain-containing protein [Corallococcus exiguus]NPC71426.1 DUF4935 domain-containing protein [Corallococcus exiguus]
MSSEEQKAKDAKASNKQGAPKVEGFDTLVANSTFPDAAAVFTAKPILLSDIKDTANVVLDTNALLVPYGIGGQTLAQIDATYRRLLQEERLFIPGQVAREFARNRVTKLSELFQKLSRKRGQLPTFRQGSYPMLEGLEDYARLRGLEEQLDRVISEYRDRLSSVVDHVKSWEWNDPVSLLYGRLFSASSIMETVKSSADIKAEHFRRFLHKIPPGYKDQSKDDDGVGDFVIWLSILELGQRSKKSVLFVSGEEKADWWYRSEGQLLYPRYELVDEFRRHSGGQSFHIIKFSHLLELFGASNTVVAEVKKEEAVSALPAVQPPRSAHAELQTQSIRAEQAAAAWLMSQGYELAATEVLGSVDFVATGNGKQFGVDVLYARRRLGLGSRLRDRAGLFKKRPFGLPVVVVVVSEDAKVLDEAEQIWNQLDPPFRLSTVLFGADGDLVPVRGL